ncbi:hypothetical protein [Lactobacillus helveticus]|uniref:hypothetical protein n=1 Tax=Lactobacillus helveticus TaxID=1587 RepID=UPI000933F0E6
MARQKSSRRSNDINQAYKYMGKPWLAGCSSSPAYGVDCSGLVMQGLYAGGISPIPTSSIGHAHLKHRCMILKKQ